MDSEFQRRWRDNIAPFNGVTVTLNDFVLLLRLQRALAVVVQCLYDCRPGTNLLRLRDWHEHDGFVTQAQPSSWEQLKTLIETEEKLLTCVGDSYVREAFFPEARDWYLHIYVPDHGDNPHYRYDDPNLTEFGIFDITCAEPLADEITRVLETAGILEVKITGAKAFFDRNDAS